MKKFQFSLEKILSFKGQVRDVLKSELATLNHQLTAIEEEIITLNKIISDTNIKMQSQMQEGVTSSKISVYKMYLNEIGAQITRKNREKLKQINLIAAKQKQIINANVEVASFEKLKDKQLQEYKVLEAKAQEIELNEFMNNMKR